MQEFMSMGGYGAYVWPSYILSAVLLVALLAVSVRTLKSTEAKFDRLKATNGAQAQNQEQETESLDGDEA